MARFIWSKLFYTELAGILRNIYPDLADYLSAYRFKNELLDTYFESYKYQKTINKILPSFELVVDEQSKKLSFVDNLPARSSIVDKLDLSKAHAYFFDALGVEYLGYIQAKCNKYGLAANIVCGRCELPSLTCFNKEFVTTCQDKGFVVSDIKSLDEIKHHGEDSFSYEKVKTPVYLISELEKIDDLLKQIRASIYSGHYDKAVIIIDEDVFNLVQVELQRRSSMRRGLRNNSPFCTKLVCGDCGSFYGHKIFHAKEKHSKDVWYCNRRYQGSNNCSTPILAEGDLIRYYLQALSEILADKDRYISTCKAQMDEANALEKIRFKREKAEVALAKDIAKIQALVRENAYISQDQQVYRQRFEEMSEQIEKQKNTIAELQEQELRLVGVREKLYRFIEALESFDAEPTFDSVTWNALVERVLVNPKSLIFEFKNGEKIKITI